MKRYLLFATIVSVVGGFAPTASAGWYDIREDYCRNVNWPWPYICPDRSYSRAPFNVMVQNGWRRQNLLGSHHFDETNGKLTTAGELKIQWVITQAPQQHRQIFVERSLDPTVTNRRINIARDYAVIVAQGKATPEIYETHLLAEGRPATTVDAVNVRFQESMPPPVLPAATATNTGQ